MLATPIVEDLGLKAGEQVLAFVNGMGGTPLIELYIVFDALNRILGGKNITIARSLVGNYITSLEMAGCSITLVRLDDELTKYWDAPVHTAGLRWGI
jgi:dihydroxyacetone kinase-like protein